MSTFDACKTIHDIIIKTSTDEGWNPNVEYKKMESLSKTIKKSANFSFLDISDLNVKEMKILGFRQWESGNPMMLIPLWLFHFVNPELDVICIDGTVDKFKNADNDNRAGLLAYGIIPKS